MDSPPYPFDPSSTDAFYLFSPYGLDESAIRTIPLTIYTKKNCCSSILDCAVCLLEFEDNDYVRTLPSCSHSFHVDCIDIWLRSHANCPLCRAGIIFRRPESPFTPLMAARIPPSFLDDDVIIAAETTTVLAEEQGEIITHDEQEPSYRGRDFLLKRSYSFSFERNIGSERLVLEAATTSPWRYRRGGNTNGSFWNKRPSPFSSLMKPRVVSFRYYRGMKSPLFFRRRSSVGFFPLSESSGRFSSSSRRRNFFSSPMFAGRSSAGGGGGGGGVYSSSSSSRLRSGDPEALLSPDRYNNRRWR